jgi:hypothetical protein
MRGFRAKRGAWSRRRDARTTTKARSASAVASPPERDCSTPEGAMSGSQPLWSRRSTAAAIGETTARSRREEPVDLSAELSLLVLSITVAGTSSHEQDSRFAGPARL